MKLLLFGKEHDGIVFGLKAQPPGSRGLYPQTSAADARYLQHVEGDLPPIKSPVDCYDWSGFEEVGSTVLLGARPANANIETRKNRDACFPQASPHLILKG